MNWFFLCFPIILIQLGAFTVLIFARSHLSPDPSFFQPPDPSFFQPPDPPLPPKPPNLFNVPNSNSEEDFSDNCPPCAPEHCPPPSCPPSTPLTCPPSLSPNPDPSSRPKPNNSPKSSTKAPKRSSTNAPPKSSTNAPPKSSTNAPTTSSTNAPTTSSTNAPTITSTNSASISSTNASPISSTNIPPVFSTITPTSSSSNGPPIISTNAPPISSTTTPPDSSTISPSGGSTISPPDSSTISLPDSSTITPPISSTTTPPISSTITPSDSSTITPSDSSTITPSDSSTITPSDSSTITPSDSSTITPSDSSTITPSDSSTISLPNSSTISPPDSSTIFPPDSSTTTPPDSTTITPPISSTSATPSSVTNEPSRKRRNAFPISPTNIPPNDPIKTLASVFEYITLSCPPSDCLSTSAETPDIMLMLFFQQFQKSNSQISHDLVQSNLVSDIMQTLKTRQTIKEVALMENPNYEFPHKEKLLYNFKSYKNNKDDKMLLAEKDGGTLKTKVTNSITRVLNFFNLQMTQTNIPDIATALMFLKGMDDKHGKIFQKTFPLKKWIFDACERIRANSLSFAIFCNQISRQWINKSGDRKNKTRTIYWKNASILQNQIEKMDRKIVENIGNENDEIWPTLSIQCFMAIGRCEFPLACERTFLDPMPRSQYLLIHQVLMRIFIDMVNCPNLRHLVTEEKVYRKLCSKMYMEAKYLEMLNFPIVYRGLFAELVGLCGYLGYTNFFQNDWLQNFLSWQSKSDNGCFVKDSKFPAEVITNDVGIIRQATKSEFERSDQTPSEECLPHLTAMNLVALSTYWDYLLDNFDN